MESDILDNVRALNKGLQDDQNHRYRSWEHCFTYFQQRKGIDENIACLHLAFYLASWGMYRGSSFLLWKDYLIHNEAVRELLSPRYECLWTIDYDNMRENESEIDLLFDLIGRIRNCYEINISHVNGQKKKVNVTDTLVTKILLGTIGCVPAYDNFFISGLRLKNLSFSSLNKKNFWELVEFCQKNSAEFRNAKMEISSSGVDYPIMKIVDMYFWNVGFADYMRKKEEPPQYLQLIPN